MFSHSHTFLLEPEVAAAATPQAEWLQEEQGEEPAEIWLLSSKGDIPASTGNKFLSSRNNLMAKQFPTWSQDKYNCVKSNLAGVHAILRLEKLEAAHSKLNDELAKIHKNELSGPNLLSAIEDEILALVNSRQNGEDRFVTLVEKYRKSQNKFVRFSDQNHRQIATETAFSILCQFMKFDPSKFRALFQKHFGQELANNPAQTKKTQLEKDRALNKNKQYKVWNDNNFGQFFQGGKHGVPAHWGSMDIQKGHKKRDIGKKILREFMEDWRNRARLFSEAVTINGVLISSLPDPMRRSWKAAYEQAKLGEQHKNPIYIARKSDIVDKSVSSFMPVMSTEG